MRGPFKLASLVRASALTTNRLNASIARFGRGLTIAQRSGAGRGRQDEARH